MRETVKKTKAHMNKAVEVLQDELKTLRTGRASLGHPRRRPGRLLRHADAAQPGRELDGARPDAHVIQPWDLR